MRLAKDPHIQPDPISSLSVCTTLHSARLVSALRSPRQPNAVGTCWTLLHHSRQPLRSTHTKQATCSQQQASERASKHRPWVLPTPYAKHAATRSAELAVSSPLVPVQYTNQRLQRVNSSIFRLLSAVLAIYLCTQPHPRHDHHAQSTHLQYTSPAAARKLHLPRARDIR